MTIFGRRQNSIRGELSDFRGSANGEDSSIWRRIRAGSDWGSHGFLLSLIPQGLRLLDLGCNDGALSRKLGQAGARHVVAIDIRLSAVVGASANSNAPNVHYMVADTERLPFAASVGAEFDAVVCADVLEHLNDPGQVLRELSVMLGGGEYLRRAYVSLPNIAYWRVRQALALGGFEYQDSGIMDRTHRWFFTKKSAERLLSENGWVILRMLPVAGNKAPSLRGRLGMMLARTFPTLFAYQMVFECYPDRLHVSNPLRDEEWAN